MALLRLLPLLALACSEVDPGVGLFDEQQTAPEADAGVVRPDAGDGGGTALTEPAGTWALFIEDRKCLAALGSSIENIIWSWYRVEITEEAGGSDGQVFLRQHAKLCNQELSPLVGGLLTLIPKAVTDGLPARTPTGFLLGEEPGSDFVADEITDLWGAMGVGPEDALPEDPDDPRVVDHDGDGNPGVSVVLANPRGDPLCEVYLVQRTRLRLSGKVVNANRIEGTVWSLLDKAVVGETSPLCGTQAQIVASPTPSRFVMVRVDGETGIDLDLNDDGDVTCAEIDEAKTVLHERPDLARVEPDDSVCE